MNDTAAEQTLRVDPRRLKFWDFNPEKVLYYAYAMYVADDPTKVGTFRHQEAVENSSYFRQQRGEPGSHDEKYRMAVGTVAVSYIGAIQRLNRVRQESLKLAHADYNDLLMGRIGRQIVNGFVRVCIRYGIAAFVIALLAVFGAALAQVLAPIIPMDFAQITGREAPSWLGAAGFAVVGTVVTVLWNFYYQAHLNKRLRLQVNAAEEAFAGGRLSAYNQHLFDLCEFWKEYTGEEYKVASSLAAMLEDDLEMLRTYLDQQNMASRSHFRALWDGVQKILPAVRKTKKHNK